VGLGARGDDVVSKPTSIVLGEDVQDMSNAAIVQTDSGPVRGTVTGEYRLFQGIPYAASTAGAQRWRSPEPVHAWTEPRDATKPGNICAQQPSAYADVASLDEVCLFLNVTTPRWTGADRLRPVMVWIHGDGAIGAGSFFDARPLVITGDVIVVTINYRLGIFGTFGYPGLDGSGTFGMQDQRAALRWVQRNAASFGGDPDNVTLFGESYGGLATSAHLISPGSQGLFHRAIIQSGFALMDMPAGALYPGVPAVEWFGCSGRGTVGLHGFPHGAGVPAPRTGASSRRPLASRAVRVRQSRPPRGSGRVRRARQPGACAISRVGLRLAECRLGERADRPDVGPIDLRAAPPLCRTRTDLRV